jgi:hypothetical protein
MSRKKGPTKEDRRRERVVTLVRLRHRQRKGIDECAREMKVAYRTIQYWLADPEYAETVKELQEECKGAAETRIAEMAQIALDTMTDVMLHGKSDVARVNAAATHRPHRRNRGAAARVRPSGARVRSSRQEACWQTALAFLSPLVPPQLRLT